MVYICTAYYRFGSNEMTSVRCVHVSCNDMDVCIFALSEDGTELQVSMNSNPLQSSDKCMVNFVEIIHDCMPRSVDLTLKFTSYPGDDKLYLQVNKDHKLKLSSTDSQLTTVKDINNILLNE